MPKIKRACQNPNCKREFEIYPSQLKKGGGKYCSFKCTKKGEWRNCPGCGTRFYAQRSRISRSESTYCSQKCGNPARGKKKEENPNWKGGRFKRSDGYIAVRLSEDEYRLEHDLVVEQSIGRRLRPGENVHHKNGVRDDNRLENLELIGVADHISQHHPPQKQPDKWVHTECANPRCRKMFAKRKSQYLKTKTHYCCRACYREGMGGER